MGIKRVEAEKILANNFGIREMDYIDAICSSISNCYKIDIIKFNDFLVKEKGYDENGQSIKEFLEKNYGEKVMKQIEAML